MEARRWTVGERRDAVQVTRFVDGKLSVVKERGIDEWIGVG